MPSGIRGLITIPAPSIPRASKSRPALPTLHLRAPSRCGIGGGVKATLHGLQYQAETAQQSKPGRREASRNDSSPFFKKKMSLSWMNKKFTGSRSLGPSQADGGWKLSTPAGLALTYLAPHSVWLSAEVWGMTLKIYSSLP